MVFDVAPGEFLDTWTHLLKLRRGLCFYIETHLLDETMTRCRFLEHIRSTGEVLYEAKILTKMALKNIILMIERWTTNDNYYTAIW